MTKKRIFDFDNELAQDKKSLEGVFSQSEVAKSSIKADSSKLEDLETELAKLSEKMGISTPVTKKAEKSELDIDWENKFFLNNNPLILETKIQQEIFKNPQLLPPLNHLEYAIVGLAGVTASLLDFLVVKIPKDINYLQHFEQKGSQFTEWLKSFGINKDGKLNPFLKWLETTCKVPFDQSVNPDIQGFYPKTHRLLSLGHDPLFGLLFGTFDILNGSMTVIDTTGKVQIVKSFDLVLENKIFAPFLWLGHIISDICTKMGIPIPGWGFLQILQFGKFGTQEKTIADISRWMYLNGYDIRHFVTMSVPVAVIEIVIRTYHLLSNLENKEQLNGSLIYSQSSQELMYIKSNLKLHKMLFLAHAIAASGNAIKIFAYQGNPLAINLSQWLMFAQESVTVAKTIMRDKMPEKIVRNRERINKEWEEIKNIQIGQSKLFEQNSSIYYEIYKTHGLNFK